MKPTSDRTENLSEKPSGFWGRQFADETTQHQVVFDWLFVVVLPIACLVFDPIVFKGDIGGGMLYSHKPLGYLAIGLGMFGFLFWRLCPGLTRRIAGVVAGILIGAFIFSLSIGVLMLPFTIVGMVILIGFLGLTPFFTSFALLRNGVILARAARSGRAFTIMSVCLGAFIYCTLAVGTQWFVQHKTVGAVEKILEGKEHDQRAAIETLKSMSCLADLDKLVFAWEKDPNEARKDRMAVAYKEITGTSIGGRLFMLRD